MPSHLRLQSSFEPFSAETTRSHFLTAPPQKKQKMSLTQTYYIAASARSKLGKEASRPDHDLRLLVGHANLLDSLMVELADAEREQEAWFNQSVRKAAKADEPKHIQWVDRIVEEQDDDDDSASDSSDSDSDSDFDDADLDMILSLRRTQSPAVYVSTHEVDEEDEQYEDDEDDEEHALARTPSAQSPPELVHDDESDDDTPPSSPPSTSVTYSEEQRQAITTTGFYDKTISEHGSFVKDGFFAQQRSAPMIASF